MRKIKIIFTFALIFCCLIISAQENHNLKWSISVGSDDFTGNIQKPDRLREYKSQYGYDYFACGNMFNNQDVNLIHFGGNVEYYFLKNRLGITGGLQFSQLSTTLQSDRDYFYWLESEDGFNTNYLRLNDITQKLYYLGAPVELIYFPVKRDRFVKMYLKLGLSVNYRIADKTAVNFADNAMDKYENAVKTQLNSDISPFFVYSYTAIGLKFGKINKPQVSLEFRFPEGSFKNNFSPIISDTNGLFGAGVQLSVGFPINNNTPIGK